MLFSVLAGFFMLSAIDGDAILQKAHDSGFFYRSVSFIKVDDCGKKDLCFKSKGGEYLIKRKDNVTISAEIKEGKLEIDIIPDNTYISYYLYIEHKAGVHKIQMKTRKLVIDSGVSNIIRLQVVGTGTNGPIPIFTKTFRKTETPITFSGDFDSSLKKLRQRYSMPFLENDPELGEPAKKVLERVGKSGIVHYSSQSGGLIHTGIRKSIVGENLFHAKTIEKGWEMMVKSPSHLFNLISPSYRSYYLAATEEEGFVSGVVLFSN
jgi:hypothetical protein